MLFQGQPEKRNLKFGQHPGMPNWGSWRLGGTLETLEDSRDHWPQICWAAKEPGLCPGGDGPRGRTSEINHYQPQRRKGQPGTYQRQASQGAPHSPMSNSEGRPSNLASVRSSWRCTQQAGLRVFLPKLAPGRQRERISSID